MKLYNRIVIFVLAILPITSYYCFWGTNITLNTIILIGLFFLNLLFTRRMSLNKTFFPMIFLSVWLLISTLLNSVLNGYNNYAINAFLLIVLMSLVLLTTDFSKIGGYVKVYEFICYLICGFLLVQFLFYYAFGIRVTGKLPGFQLLEEYRFLESTFGVNIGYTLASFSSVFSERSHFALYCMPLLCIYLFGLPGKKKKSFIKSVVLSALMMMTFSGNAIIVVACLWALFIFLKLKNRSSKEKLSAIFLTALAAVAFIVLMQNDSFYQTVNRLFFYNGDVSSTDNTKAAYRIYRGFDFFRQLPFINKLFGVGYRSLTEFAGIHSISSVFDVSGETSYEYLSAFFQTLIYGGVVCFGIYIFFIIKLFLNSKNTAAKAIIFSIVLLSISSSILCDYTWLLYVSIAVFVSPYKESVLKEVKRFIYEKNNDCFNQI